MQTQTQTHQIDKYHFEYIAFRSVPILEMYERLGLLDFAETVTPRIVAEAHDLKGKSILGFAPNRLAAAATVIAEPVFSCNNALLQTLANAGQKLETYLRFLAVYEVRVVETLLNEDFPIIVGATSDELATLSSHGFVRSKLTGERMDYPTGAMVAGKNILGTVPKHIGAKARSVTEFRITPAGSSIHTYKVTLKETVSL